MKNSATKQIKYLIVTRKSCVTQEYYFFYLIQLFFFTMQKFFWLEQLDTSTMNGMYLGQSFAISECF